MKMFFTVVAACAASLVWAASPVQSKVGDPIPGIPVGLEGDPDGIVVAKGETDGGGNVTFSNQKPGRYVVTLIDTSKLKVLSRVTISGPSTASVVSEPFAVGSTKKAYALGKNGRRLVVEIAAPSTQTGAAAKVVPGTIKVRVETTR